LADLVAALEADGIFLDTMDRGAAAFRAKLDTVRKGVVLESEDALPLERVYDHHMSWAQWFPDSQAPAVLRNKWFERRHMQHQIKRWDRDHTGELQAAWMNGAGVLIWENVFGSWNGWSPRDRSLLRGMLSIQRRFADLFAGEKWTPLTPVLMRDVYASLWEGDGVRLWTVVNRSSNSREGALMQIELRNGERVFDLITGEEAVVRVDWAASSRQPRRCSGVISRSFCFGNETKPRGPIGTLSHPSCTRRSSRSQSRGGMTTTPFQMTWWPYRRRPFDSRRNSASANAASTIQRIPSSSRRFRPCTDPLLSSAMPPLSLMR
jgi:hypothetical protein